MKNESNWHQCSQDKCDMVHLKTHVCMAEGMHACPGKVCNQHPGSSVVYIDNIWGCNDTGNVHECNACTPDCTVKDGVCVISGKPTSVNDITCVSKPQGAMTNRRCRRRRPTAQTNHQVACILLFDLLFSNRRRKYEEARHTIYNDIARRQGVKYARTQAKEGKMLHLQEIVDIYVCNKERLRPISHLYAFTLEQQQAICRKYADVIYRVWVAFSTTMSRRVTFDAAAAALLYHMRRGLALDGMNIVPMDTFLFNSLPDAHSIKDVGVSRRAFTHAKNAFSDAFRDATETSKTRAEEIAGLFKFEFKVKN